MNKTHDTPKPARFSKEDLLKEVRNLVLLDARSRSWVYDPGAAYRLLGWKPPHGFGGALLDIELYDFDEAAEGEGQSANLGHLPLVQVFEQLYDYGVLGLRRQDMEPLEPATMPAFVACWMNDVRASMLVSEAHNGQQPSLRLPGITIDLALAPGGAGRCRSGAPVRQPRRRPTVLRPPDLCRGRVAGGHGRAQRAQRREQAGLGAHDGGLR